MFNLRICCDHTNKPHLNHYLLCCHVKLFSLFVQSVEFSVRNLDFLLSFLAQLLSHFYTVHYLDTLHNYIYYYKT